MGDPVCEPVVVPWTVDCVPVVPANLTSLFITSYHVHPLLAYMFASALPCRYHPIDFFDLSTNLFVLLIFTCDLCDFFDLSMSHSSE